MYRWHVDKKHHLCKVFHEDHMDITKRINRRIFFNDDTKNTYLGEIENGAGPKATFIEVNDIQIWNPPQIGVKPSCFLGK